MQVETLGTTVICVYWADKSRAVKHSSKEQNILKISSPTSETINRLKW